MNRSAKKILDSEHIDILVRLGYSANYKILYVLFQTYLNLHVPIGIFSVYITSFIYQGNAQYKNENDLSSNEILY